MVKKKQKNLLSDSDKIIQKVIHQMTAYLV